MKSGNSLALNIIYKDLALSEELVYRKCGFEMSVPEAEAESKAYGACIFKLGQRTARFRVAKSTPKKVGQFVTLWKRVDKGPIQPFDISDDPDLYIVSVKNDQRFGQFIFPASVLLDKGVLSDQGKEGKRAMRVYPPWDVATSKQAQQTQQWQLAYFLDIYGVEPLMLDRAKRLLTTSR